MDVDGTLLKYSNSRDLFITINNSDCIFFRDLQKC
jgi:hypothetical protein